MKHVCDCSSANDLVLRGPLAEVTLLPHPTIRGQFIATGNMPIARVKMMVDTGADRTLIEQSVADSMGLIPINFIPIVGVSQQAEMSPVYLMTIGLDAQHDTRPQKIRVDFNAEVVGMKSPQTPRQYVGLIGRDFLRGVHLVYNGSKGTVELHISSEVTGNPPTLRAKKNRKKRRR